jgi:hypothetical protein
VARRCFRATATGSVLPAQSKTRNCRGGVVSAPHAVWLRTATRPGMVWTPCASPRRRRLRRGWYQPKSNPMSCGCACPTACEQRRWWATLKLPSKRPVANAIQDARAKSPPKPVPVAGASPWEQNPVQPSVSMLWRPRIAVAGKLPQPVQTILRLPVVARYEACHYRTRACSTVCGAATGAAHLQKT